jgi:hypothetical protein
MSGRQVQQGGDPNPANTRDMSAQSRLLIAGVASVLLLIGVLIAWPRSPEPPATVTWEPLSRPRPEADTLFLPDLASARTINDGGGFLEGADSRSLATLASDFQFGAGRFGPAVRPIPGRGDFVYYPVDGLLDGREFTLEFWAKSDRPWSAIDTGKASVAVRGGPGGNRLQILAPFQGQCAIYVGSLETVPNRAFSRTWQKPCDDLGLTANTWHHIALTLKRGTMRIYIDGHMFGVIGGVRFLPLWSDTTKGEGFQLGGESGASNGIWISDVRASRTARTPGVRVRLRTLTGAMSVDASGAAGSVPERYVGSLKVAPISPEQARSALGAIREADSITATPIKRGAPDGSHPSAGRGGKFSYDWQVVDRTLQWLRTRGLAGYLGADSTPQILGGSVPPNPATPFFGSTWARQVPNDQRAWATIIGDLVGHVKQRGYVVPTWSVWNEPDLGSAFWQGTLKQYLDLYTATARAIKAADPTAQVGGPEIYHLDPLWIRALFKRAKTAHVPLDFISFHDYSGDLNTLTQARRLVDVYAGKFDYASPFPIAIGEFNWSDRNEPGSGVARFNAGFWHVRSLNAAYTTAALIHSLQLGGFRQLMWSHTAGVYGPIRSGRKYATMQLLGDHGEQWAPFNALVGWKRTVGTRLLPTAADFPPGVFGLASKDPISGKLGLVFANYGWAQRLTRTVKVSLKNLAPGSYRLRRYLVDRAHSSRWDVAQDGPEGSQANDLQTVEDRTIDASDAAHLSIDLPIWSSTFIMLEPA